MELDGKVSVVTGASRGKADADNVAETIVRLGGEAMPVEADIRDGEAVKAMMQQVIDKWGKIDILVNSAGITRDTLLLRMSDDAWDDVMSTNLRGAYLCTKFALRSMIRQGWGRIVNIASIAGLIGNVGQTNYAASKGGLIAFTKSVAREVGSRNITANAVAPGFINTQMTQKLPDEVKKSILAMTSLQRIGEPEEVAELVAFLASDRAGYITGQVICIDGGIST